MDSLSPVHACWTRAARTISGIPSLPKTCLLAASSSPAVPRSSPTVPRIRPAGADPILGSGSAGGGRRPILPLRRDLALDRGVLAAPEDQGSRAVAVRLGVPDAADDDLVVAAGEGMLNGALDARDHVR